MPWTRPTLTELRQLARSLFAARLPGADATLRRSNINVTADVMAGLANGEYGYLDYLIRQNFTDTAEGDYLLRKGAMYGLFPTGATKASGNVTVTGIDGKTIPDQVILFQDNNGRNYITQATVDIAVGTATVPVQAVEGGSASNLENGAPLSLIYAIAGIDAVANVAAPGLSGGTDEESIEAFRLRVLARQKQPPQGGIYSDYIAWAKTVAGVTRAWVYPANRGLGTVDLTFVMDGRANIIPLTADIGAVQAAIDAKRPVTDSCVVFAPVPVAVDFDIEGPFTDAQKDAIEASVKDMFLEEAQPGGAYDPMTQGTYSGGLSFEAHIDPAVAAGAGDVIFDITDPTADIPGNEGEILVPGVFTFS